MNCGIHIAMSLDGYIADTTGSIAWLDRTVTDPQVGSRVLAYIAASDTIIMGRLTYEQVLGFGDWMYPQQKTLVVSSSLSAASSPNTTIVQPADLEMQLSSGNAQQVWIVGGAQVNALMLELELVDEIYVTVIPILLGAGRSLVSALPDAITLDLRSVTQLPQSCVELNYGIRRD
jgi:dihydrofolate reductase